MSNKKNYLQDYPIIVAWVTRRLNVGTRRAPRLRVGYNLKNYHNDYNDYNLDFESIIILKTIDQPEERRSTQPRRGQSSE